MRVAGVGTPSRTSRIVVSSLFPHTSAVSYVFTVGIHQPSRTESAYRAVPCWMQRSITTSTPRSGLRSVGSTSSRSSMTLVSTPRDASSWRSSFSSTRTRERRTPMRGPCPARGPLPPGLLTPVFFGLGCERERDRRYGGDLELRAAVGARDDLALHRIGADGHVGVAFRTLGHRRKPSPADAARTRVTASRPRLRRRATRGGATCRGTC